ncbi:MAG: tetratricopeptide repeat protein [Muribaculaceae bacterium]|nr:tetratricopeptide repeat protein [Muribaculaceae bacterium]
MKALLKIWIILLAIPMGLSAQINTDQVLRVGQNALYFEDYMLSIQYFNQVIKAKPYLAQPYFFRSIAKLNLEDFKGAEADATEAIERNPFITDAYEVRGVARQNLGRYAESVKDYDKALELLPYNRGLMLNKALAEQDMEDYEASRKTFTALLDKYPNYDNAYVGRARLNILTGDTVAALADLDRATSLNKNLVNAYVLRADISIKKEQNYEQALADMNEAIKLQPRFAGFFINRAFLRYHLDDYFGAMADYDYAIGLDPTNNVAYFNRGLLRAEVHDNDKAIADFSRVIQMDPNDYRALFNRSMLYTETGDYKNALADIDRVVDAFPDYDGALLTRFQIYDKMGDKRKAEADYRAAMALSKKIDKVAESHSSGEQTEVSKENPKPADSEELTKNRFSTLLTIENDHNVDQEYNNKSIRGRVQDHRVQAKLSPLFTISYYASTNQLHETPYYIKEVDEINATRSLRRLLMVTDAESTVDDEADIREHFNSIEYYNSYISTHAPRSIDYFGRAMDFISIHNYSKAIEDFSRAIGLTPDLAPAYLMRAVARYRQAIAERDTQPADADSRESFALANARLRAEMDKVLQDYDKLIELSPRMPFAYFNKGVMLAQTGDLTQALQNFSRTIELKPDMGEAYYNRGFVYLQLGQKEKGISDLSKAGELGVVESYNLLKQMGR